MEYKTIDGQEWAVDAVTGEPVAPWSPAQPTDLMPPPNPAPVPVDLGEAVPLADAAASVTALEEQLARWAADGAAAGAELADLEARAGEEALDDPGSAAGLSEAMVKLRARGDVARRAAQAAAGRLQKAQRVVLVSRAADVRLRAARLVHAADARQVQTDKLLARLAQYEGAQYVPYEPLMHFGMGRREEFSRPLTAVIRGHAAWLVDQATSLEQVAQFGDPAAIAARATQPHLEPSDLEAAVTDSGTLVGAEVQQFTGMVAVG